MKKFLSVLLVFSLLLSSALFSCENKPDNKDDGDEKEKEPARELTEEEKAIMDEVIFLMEDDTYDTDELIGKFFGDFYVDRFDGSDLPYSKIYKVGDVLAIEYKNNETNYQIVKDSKLCTVTRTNDGAKLHLSSNEDYPYSYPLSVFTAFGVDMSSVYSTEESTEEEPKVTYDSLTVSKDKKSVTFSDDYLKEVAKFICTAFEPTEKELNKFLDEMSASGVFTLDDQSAKFSFEGVMGDLGSIKMETSFSYKDKKPASLTSSITLTMESDGVPVTTTQENIIRNMEYENDELVSLTVESRNLTNSKATQNGVTVDYSTSVIGVYDFILENSAPATLNVMVNANQTISYAGQKQESSSSLTLFVKDNNLTYDLSANGLQQAYIAAEGFTFSTPENVTIPEDIYTVLPK